MARKILQKPNVVAADGTYTNGRIKDRVSPSEPGTPGSVEVYGDFHQFYDQLMKLGSVTANGNPDNDANGYQLVQAFYKAAALLQKELVFIVNQSGTAAPTVEIIKNTTDIDGSSLVTLGNLTRTGAGIYTIEAQNMPSVGVGAENPEDYWTFEWMNSRFNTSIADGVTMFPLMARFNDTTALLKIHNAQISAGSTTFADTVVKQVFRLRAIKTYADAPLSEFNG